MNAEPLPGADLLRGVTVPMVTPMSEPGRPDAAAGADLLAALHASGVDALMLLGSNGEGPLLGTSTLGEFVAETVTRWHGLGARRPVLVNVTAAGTAEVLARAEAVLPAAPDALVLSPPIYFHHRDDEIVAHYAACARVGLPIVAYNAPRYSNPITPPVFDALLEMEHVIGVKDSSGDLAVLRRMIESARRRRPGFGIGQGAEHQLVAGLRAGADGIVPGIANLAPGPAVRLYRSVRSGENDGGDADGVHPAVEHLQADIDRLCGIHRIRPGVPAVKAVLAWRGLCPLHVAAPLLPCTEGERAELVSYLARMTDLLIA